MPVVSASGASFPLPMQSACRERSFSRSWLQTRHSTPPQKGRTLHIPLHGLHTRVFDILAKRLWLVFNPPQSTFGDCTSSFYLAHRRCCVYDLCLDLCRNFNHLRPEPRSKRLLQAIVPEIRVTWHRVVMLGQTLTFPAGTLVLRKHGGRYKREYTLCLFLAHLLPPFSIFTPQQWGSSTLSLSFSLTP